MADTSKESDHWRELAELLGLPPEGAAPSPAAANRPQPEKAAPPAVVETAPAREKEPVDAAGLPPAQPREWVGKGVARDETAPVTEIEESQHAATAPEPEEDRPRRGQRRGRRGHKERGEDRMDRDRSRAEEPVGVGEEAAHEEEEKSERGAGWERRRDAEDRDVEPEIIEEAEDVEEASPPPEDDEDDADIDKLKDWNVPTWNELIAALYRPDR
jgi:hypothetical protein